MWPWCRTAQCATFARGSFVRITNTAEISRRHFAARVRHKFVDKIRLEVIGGAGGKGLISFESLDNVKQRPIGGHGGRGGDVVIEASQSVRDLNFQTYVIRGHDGGMARGHGNNGRAGKTKKLIVPVGTVIKAVTRTFDVGDADEFTSDDTMYDDGISADDIAGRPLWRRGGAEALYDGATAPTQGRSILQAGASLGTDAITPARRGRRRGSLPRPPPPLPIPDEPLSLLPQRFTKAGLPFSDTFSVLADLDVHGAKLLVARGGNPGVGNRGSQLFYADQIRGEHRPHIAGSAGETVSLELELKSIADVGLVGFPNAGKSSFLGAVSKAKPIVAEYPFTTLHPNIGVIRFADTFTMTVADIPGLIEGAHADRGLGHEFLRHIIRTRALVYVIDASSGIASAGSGAGPVADLRTLQRELQLYDPFLPSRPSIVVANKADLRGAAEGIAALRAATTMPVVATSAMHRTGVGDAINALRWLLEASRAAEQVSLADDKAAVRS